MQQKQTLTHIETIYLMTTAIFLTWYRTFIEIRLWVEPGLMACQTCSTLHYVYVPLPAQEPRSWYYFLVKEYDYQMCEVHIILLDI